MHKLAISEIKDILKRKNLDPRVGWFYIQFKNHYEEEYVIDEISLEGAIKDLLGFLRDKRVSEVLFFPEPSYEYDIPSGILRVDELENFLRKNVNTITNTHVADKDLDWIFTITHEDDFFISGNKALVSDFITFFKDARCTPYKVIKEKWNK